MQRWEYKVLTDHPSIEEINKLGAEGWELVAAVGDVFAQMVFFKRPISHS